MSTQSTRIEGCLTAIVSPMKDGKLDESALFQHVQSQIKGGVDGIVVLGTTGEAATLSDKEKEAAVKVTLEATKGEVPVVVGAGSNNTAEAIRNSLKIAAWGGDALLHVTPYYNRPSQEGHYQHFKAIAEKSPLPILLYDVPGRTGTTLLPETVARLSEIPQIIGLKDATGKLTQGSETLALVKEGFSILSGDDFTAFPFYALGGKGVISVVSNVAPALMSSMWDATSEGDWELARACHYKLYPLIGLLFQEPNPVPAKAALALLGQMEDEVRLPLVSASEELKGALSKALRDLGLLS